MAGDLKATLALAEQLDEHGERPGRLDLPGRPPPARGAPAASLLDAGMPEQKVGEALKGAALGWRRRRSRKAKKADGATLERAICVFADLEVELRGGGEVRVDEDAAFSLALARAAG